MIIPYQIEAKDLPTMGELAKMVEGFSSANRDCPVVITFGDKVMFAVGVTVGPYGFPTIQFVQESKVCRVSGD